MRAYFQLLVSMSFDVAANSQAEEEELEEDGYTDYQYDENLTRLAAIQIARRCRSLKKFTLLRREYVEGTVDQVQVICDQRGIELIRGGAIGRDGGEGRRRQDKTRQDVVVE